MKPYTWDRDVVSVVTTNYAPLERKTTKNTTGGLVSEALIQKFYGEPINKSPNGSDPGWDLVINGAKVDIKTSCHDVRFFGGPNQRWTVTCYHGLPADVYLFAEIDLKNEALVGTGYMTPDEIRQKGVFYKSGDIIPGFVNPCNGDCYLIKMTDLHEIF